MSHAAVLVTVLMFGLASTVQAQGTYRDTLARQLSAIGQTVAGSGYRPHVVGSRPIDWAREASVTFQAGNTTGSSVGLEVVLQSGVRYRIVSVPYDWDADDCGKTLEDSSGNTLLTGVWSEDRLENVLDFTANTSGTYIFVADCPDGSEGFSYWYESMTPADSFQTHPGAYPSDMIVGFLRSGATVGLEVFVEAGFEYLIAGVCDHDCTDLDLALTGDDGWLVEDELDDDAPVLQFTAPAVGFHLLEIRMYACSIEPCSFAYQVYRR
jgi:hypothetical protein